VFILILYDDVQNNKKEKQNTHVKSSGGRIGIGVGVGVDFFESLSRSSTNSTTVGLGTPT